MSRCQLLSLVIGASIGQAWMWIPWVPLVHFHMLWTRVSCAGGPQTWREARRQGPASTFGGYGQISAAAAELVVLESESCLGGTVAGQVSAAGLRCNGVAVHGQ